MCFVSGYRELVGQFRNQGIEEGTKEAHHSLGTQGNHSVNHSKGHTPWEPNRWTLPTVFKKKWKCLLASSGNEWAGNWFHVAQSHTGCLWGVSNKMYSRNQCIILSVPSLPLAGVTTRNSFIPLGPWNWETIQEILEVRQPIAVFVFLLSQAVGKVHRVDILIYSLMPGLFTSFD